MTRRKKELCVVGFLLKGKSVLLIQKTHPEWQRGKFNGIGGHIQPEETPREAMAREAKEEADINVNWTEFCEVHYPNAIVHFFYSVNLCKPRTLTTEQVSWQPVEVVLTDKVVDGLCWLVPMAVEFFTSTVPMTVKVIPQMQ